jgi:transcriptional regulator with XRE-family HTH domain
MSSQVTELRLPTWTLGDRLRKARELTGLQQKDFADALGVTRNTVGNYESDKTTTPQRTVLRAWASLCEVPYEWLTGDGLTRGPDEGMRARQSLPRTDSNRQSADYLPLTQSYDFRPNELRRSDFKVAA